MPARIISALTRLSIVDSTATEMSTTAPYNAHDRRRPLKKRHVRFGHVGTTSGHNEQDTDVDL